MAVLASLIDSDPVAVVAVLPLKIGHLFRELADHVAAGIDDRCVQGVAEPQSAESPVCAP